jgi:hypothetical protein
MEDWVDELIDLLDDLIETPVIGHAIELMALSAYWSIVGLSRLRFNRIKHWDIHVHSECSGNELNIVKHKSCVFALLARALQDDTLMTAYSDRDFRCEACRRRPPRGFRDMLLLSGKKWI